MPTSASAFWFSLENLPSVYPAGKRINLNLFLIERRTHFLATAQNFTIMQIN